MEFQRGDLVRTTWFDGWKTVKGPAIVIEAISIAWIRVWIPARNKTIITTGYGMKHYAEARGKQ